MDRLEKEIAALDGQIHDMEVQENQLILHISQTKQQIEFYQADCERLRGEIQNCDSSIEGNASQKQELQRQNEEAQTRQQEAAGETETLSERIREVSGELETLKEKQRQSPENIRSSSASWKNRMTGCFFWKKKMPVLRQEKKSWKQIWRAGWIICGTATSLPIITRWN